MPTRSDPDALYLRRVLRDLVALSGVPVAWVGKEPSAIVADLADLLVGSLHVDSAFVRLCDPDGSAAVEIARGKPWPTLPKWLQPYFAKSGRLLRSESVPGTGDGARTGRGIVVPVGVDAEVGLVAAASDHPDFPSEIDQLLLSVAANHAATAFRMARLVEDHRRAEAALRDSERQLRQARDELETKVAERTGELSRSEYSLRQIIETVPGFLWSTGPDGEPTRVNERVLKYSGMRFEDFLHLGWKEFLHPDDFPETANAFYYAIQTGTSYQAVHRLRRADGEYRWYHARGEPLRDEQGRIIQWYGLSIDIDEGKRAEDQLRSTQTRLARASQIATVAELSASIAHEINQPLAAVVANAQTCQTWLSGSSPNVARARAAVDRIVRDATAAAEVVRRIRALFSQAAPEKSQLQINEVIEEVWRLMQNEVNRRGIAAEFDLAKLLPPTAADRIQVQQVLLNLMRNGTEAMEGLDGPKRLIIRSRHVDGRIVVEVCDSGPGLADKEKAFEPFYSTKPKGMGVGLAVSRSIIQAHEGQLWARDNPPRGTIFAFTLPAP
jgi:PAS domain S-box-containing protein